MDKSTKHSLGANGFAGHLFTMNQGEYKGFIVASEVSQNDDGKLELTILSIRYQDFVDREVHVFNENSISVFRYDLLDDIDMNLYDKQVVVHRYLKFIDSDPDPKIEVILLPR